MMRTLIALALASSCLPALFSKKAETFPPYGKFEAASINESSGIVKSKRFDNVYWTHNDSGDEARIFAVTRDGKSIQTEWAIKQQQVYEGIPIGESTNIDWEDIAIDDAGNLIIAGTGNNDNARRDLALYIVPEPDPNYAWQTRATRRVDLHYPDQTAYPDPENKNFDCEAVFYTDGSVYFVSKNRSKGPAKLYRLSDLSSGESKELELIGRYELLGQATGADVSPDGSKLAVLTYIGCWLFEKPTDSDDFFSGKAYYLPLFAKQCEAICWDDPTTLIITNEQADLYEVDISQIPPVK